MANALKQAYEQYMAGTIQPPSDARTIGGGMKKFGKVGEKFGGGDILGGLGDIVGGVGDLALSPEGQRVLASQQPDEFGIRAGLESSERESGRQGAQSAAYQEAMKNMGEYLKGQETNEIERAKIAAELAKSGVPATKAERLFKEGLDISSKLGLVGEDAQAAAAEYARSEGKAMPQVKTANIWERTFGTKGLQAKLNRSGSAGELGTAKLPPKGSNVKTAKI